MSIILNPTGSRLTIRVSAVVALLLVAGCSEGRTGNGTAGQNPSTRVAEQSAELQKITLSVPGMDCPVCPITVRRALNDVEG